MPRAPRARCRSSAAAYFPGADADQGGTDRGCAGQGGTDQGRTDRERAADLATAELARMLGPGREEVIAARIALLVQGCDGTAGLIGEAIHRALTPPPDQLSAWSTQAILAEVLRARPAGAGQPAGQPEGRQACAASACRSSSMVLLRIDSANRDPAVFGTSRTASTPAASTPAASTPAAVPCRGLTFGDGLRPCSRPGPRADARGGGWCRAVRDRCAAVAGCISSAGRSSAPGASARSGGDPQMTGGDRRDALGSAASGASEVFFRPAPARPPALPAQRVGLRVGGRAGRGLLPRRSAPPAWCRRGGRETRRRLPVRPGPRRSRSRAGLAPPPGPAHRGHRGRISATTRKRWRSSPSRSPTRARWASTSRTAARTAPWTGAEQHCAEDRRYLRDRVPALFINARTDAFWLAADGAPPAHRGGGRPRSGVHRGRGPRDLRALAAADPAVIKARSWRPGSQRH